ncbi:mechanosensitive ion channel family protein [Bacteroidota bacterium]
MSISEILSTLMKIITYPIFTINQTEISLSSVVIFILILIIFLLFSRFLKNRLLNRILSRFHLEEGFQFTFLRITQYVIISIGVVVAFQFVGIDLSGLTVILGFLSVGIGFGLQNITSNFIAGLILLFERPINVGDRVTVGDTEGDVVNIHIRSTTIKSLNNISIIVPNSEFISSSVINWSHSDKKIRVDLDVGVSYNSDLDLVLKVLKDIALANPEVINKPEPEVQLKNFGDSSWDMQLRFWIENPKRYYYVRSDINCEIVREFRKNNIEIPFPQRDLHVRSSVKLPIAGKN